MSRWRITSSLRADGLDSLVGGVGSLKIASNPLLTSLDALSSVSSAKSVAIDNCSSLVLLTGLNGLKQISGAGNIVLRITNNVNLLNVDSLSSRPQEVKGEIRIDNVSLTNLNGLAGVSGQMTGSLWIANNAALTDISGLSAITRHLAQNFGQ